MRTNLTFICDCGQLKRVSCNWCPFDGFYFRCECGAYFKRAGRIPKENRLEVEYVPITCQGCGYEEDNCWCEW